MLESMVSLHSHVTRLGVLDIGSNTVHMLIVDAAPGARPEPEASTKSTVRLMQYLKADGTIKKAGVEAVVAAVEKAMGLVKSFFHVDARRFHNRKFCSVLGFCHIRIA